MTDQLNAVEHGSHRQTEGRVTRAAEVGIVALCGVLAVSNVVELRMTSAVHGDLMSWTQVLALTGPRWILLAGLLVVVLGVARRFPIWPINARGLAAHALAFAIFAFAHAVVYSLALRNFEPVNPMFSFARYLEGTTLRTMPILVLLYAAALGAAGLVDAAIDRYSRELHASQLQGELSAARLSALKAQLHPHFLYNALHAISALIGDDQKERALAATEHLADLLHAAFKDDGRDLIPLSEEIQLVDRYLALQQMRFADRLKVSSRIGPEAASALIPPLLLQPLVENAVLHGLESNSGGVTVSVSAYASGGRVSIVIENDGAQVKEDWTAAGGKGIGILEVA
jgi:two-component system LytT family sensor kinase